MVFWGLGGAGAPLDPVLPPPLGTPYSTEIDSKKDPRFMYKVSGERETGKKK